MFWQQSQLRDNIIQEGYLYHSTYFFDIPSFFEALPFLITGRQTTRTETSAEGVTFTNYHYWTITHPHLLDDNNPRTSFRAMYRMDRTSFERLVNDLSSHPAFDLRAHNALPVYVQVSCAIWRLANCHLGYRTSHMAWGVSHGSYMNFFRRFLTAVEDVYVDLISWPLESDRVNAIQNGFELPHGNRPGAIRRLPNVIGALDGKNVVIKARKHHKE